MIKTISIVGAGNVAHNLGRMFIKAEISIDSVYSRNLANAKTLAERLNAKPVDNIEDIRDSSDLLLFAVRDDVLSELGKSLVKSKQLMAHTSGSVAMDIFGMENRSAVFYPLQTFSKGKEYDGLPFPICIEARQQNDLEALRFLATAIVGAKNVFEVDSEQRKTLHVAAVFTCNFTNYFYSVAESILKERDMSFDLLKPLINETISKIDERGPSFSQTGPAVRGDKKIIDDHLSYLESHEDYKRLYQLLTDQIINNANSG